MMPEWCLAKQPTMAQKTRGADFSATDLKHELRPPELFDFAEGWYLPEDERGWRDDFAEPEEDGMLPHPVLDPMHGRIRVVNDRVVQVLTDEDIYHELVQWLDEVFEIPRGYEVYWVDLEDHGSGGEAVIEPHALIVLRDDEQVFEHEVGEPLLVNHEYKRGGHSGNIAHGEVRDGGVVPNPPDGDVPGEAHSPSKAAEIADQMQRGENATKGKNGWTWWVVGDDLITLAELRG